MMQSTALSVICYSLCSGTLVLLNKLVLHSFPFPSLVVSVQLLFALAFIYTAKHTELLKVDGLHWPFIVPYLFYIVLFSCGVYCNMRSLSQSNVETVIVFRALSPCIVAFLDVIFLGREWPTVRSWTGLGLIVAGAYGYASFDQQFQSQGTSAYFWPFLYLIIISLEMAYGKRIIKSVDLKTLSGPVLYTNLLGLPPMLMFAAMGNEYSKFVDKHMVEREPIHVSTWLFLMLGCIAGTGIGYASWWCRGQISATSFTLVGVINKCLTIILNFYMWDQHAPLQGVMCLGLCLLGGSVYRQAPMRSTTTTEEDGINEPLVSNKDDETVESMESQKDDKAVKRRG